MPRHEAQDAHLRVGHDRGVPGSGIGMETATASGSGSGPASSLNSRNPTVLSSPCRSCSGSPHAGHAIRHAPAAGVKRSRQSRQQAWVTVAPFRYEGSGRDARRHGRFFPGSPRPHSGQARFITGSSNRGVPGSKYTRWRPTPNTRRTCPHSQRYSPVRSDTPETGGSSAGATAVRLTTESPTRSRGAAFIQPTLGVGIVACDGRLSASHEINRTIRRAAFESS